MNKSLFAIVINLFLSINIYAAASCTISADDIYFGNYTGTQLDANGKITINCTGPSPPGLVVAYITISANGNPRVMTKVGGTETLQYDLYKDSGYVSRWGSTFATGYLIAPPRRSLPYQQNIPVYGRIPGQTLPSPGLYKDSTLTATFTFLP